MQLEYRIGQGLIRPDQRHSDDVILEACISSSAAISGQYPATGPNECVLVRVLVGQQRISDGQSARVQVALAVHRSGGA